ncbi:MAG TPA: Rossmann-like and DUF2520 domain-containing protein [Dongiaceae bacterium]|nr:Rossmann-like and DUF2520 domain-containing protein [Dongiaceae bacterium]
MLPGMAGKPQIAIAGAGKFGSVLALALHDAGYGVGVIARNADSSVRRAKRLAKRVESKATLDAADITAQILWLCVPEGKIFRYAALLAPRFHGKIAFHSSGARGSDELKALRKRGVAVASVHPLMTFVAGSPPSLVGVPFAVEGDWLAVEAARKIVRDLRGETYVIKKSSKNAYHAWGTFASPLLTALLATAEHVAGIAGVRGKAARRRMLPILLQTVRNYGEFGAAGGFSGPLIRGDIETVRRHLDVLRKAAVPRRVYVALAQAALEYLPSKNRDALRAILDEAD